MDSPQALGQTWSRQPHQTRPAERKYVAEKIAFENLRLRNYTAIVATNRSQRANLLHLRLWQTGNEDITRTSIQHQLFSLVLITPSGNKKFRFHEREGYPMALGMSLATYTIVHVIISLIGIGSGLIVLFGLLNGKLLTGWNGLFLLTTILTSVTGFFFPYTKLTPGIILGILSLIDLAIALYALYAGHLTGAWRRTYAITALIALYFNVFVLVAQLFEKVPAIHALAPTQTEPPFKIAKLLLLILTVVLITLAAKKFRNPLP
jgi:hypothetical protein